MPQNPSPLVSPSPLDLTTLDIVKGWLRSNQNQAGDRDDDSIQLCITSFSNWLITETGQGAQNGVNSVSPFNQICIFNEWYNGNGSEQLYLRNRPIYASAPIGSPPVTTALQLTINGVTVPQSAVWNMPGWVVDGDASSLYLRVGGGAGSGQYQTFGFPFGGPSNYFCKGIQNINVIYPAGWAQTPSDIIEAATMGVAENYKTKGWIGQSTQMMANGAGSTTYRWKIHPRVRAVITRYTRVALY